MDITNQQDKWFSGTASKDGRRYLLAGCGSGFICKFAEYPLDTVKVLEQTNPNLYKSPLDCIQQTYKSHGFLSFYRGLAQPLIGAMVENMVVFSTYGYAKELLGVANENANSLKGEVKFERFFVAGSIAGVASGFTLTPIELVKCQIQVQQSSSNTIKRGAIEITRNIINSDGIKGLWRGNLSCLVREIPGNAAWFGFYEMARYSFQLATGIEKRKDLPLQYAAMSGSFAAIGYWGIPYPADTIKSKLQTDPKYMNKSISYVFKDLIQRNGAASLYRGLPITLVRAIPSHALTFVVYEWINKFLKNY